MLFLLFSIISRFCPLTGTKMTSFGTLYQQNNSHTCLNWPRRVITSNVVTSFQELPIRFWANLVHMPDHVCLVSRSNSSMACMAVNSPYDIDASNTRPRRIGVALVPTRWFVVFCRCSWWWVNLIPFNFSCLTRYLAVDAWREGSLSWSIKARSSSSPEVPPVPWMLRTWWRRPFSSRPPTSSLAWAPSSSSRR